ncbi:immune inhibitor A domain-containing protein [Geobacillus sp. C56-T2]|uniref:immune inhibitor A domain-containing protein n=1 Tax=Geobacillus sp. C56-T2 TaxID=600773 RepID=UPI0011A7FE55|nr:immune inhibitor A domain-containing protein [Geobacillus sp. C56-T2]NNV05881.1 M6 family metalloprotease domain-containing protein [Geobacillus sp. MMMUD3]TWG30641.1 immune inhibitor A [Geobacillus sp. C56-T2]
MNKRSILSLTALLSLGVGLWASPAKAPQAANAAAVPAWQHGGPIDFAIANEEKLAEMLKKRGTLRADATPAEAEQAVRDYLRQKAAHMPREKGELYENEKKRAEALQDQLRKNSVLNGKGKKLGQSKTTSVPSVQPEPWNGGKRVDRVLVLLIEYPDFPHNRIQPNETDMYYKDYTREHYEDMIFGGDDGYYEGPNGEKLISVKKYYEEQSGGSYSIEGKVGGWYQAKYPAKYYGGNVPTPDGNDANPRALVREALAAAAKDPSINLREFDQEDRYDLDGDGNTREPDGLIDHLMIVHSSVGEEAGGGSLGGDAIWSHRWNLGSVYRIPNTTTDVPYWRGQLAAYDYTIEPADGAAGVFAHEYGHDLGLPDEYDTIYSGLGEPVAYWSIMSSGSWAGRIPGTEPTGFSAWAKQFLQSTMPGSNWLSGTTVEWNEVTQNGVEVVLDEASTKGTNNDAVRINLPDKSIVIASPAAGAYAYFSGKGNNLDSSMSTTIDLRGASQAVLTFDTWYAIENDWDYGAVEVKEQGSGQWVTVPGNITTTSNPNGQNPGNGITGTSDGWVKAQFDLSAYAGKVIDLRFHYVTDVAVAEAGWYIDNIEVKAGQTAVLTDGAEADSAFTLNGFVKSDGTQRSKHYYLIEWRNHRGVDEGLAHILRGDQLLSYDPGLVVWYVDESYDNNWTGIHPGEGFLGVVDADQHTLKWSGNTAASTRYQVHDAAFSLQKGAPFRLKINGAQLIDNDTSPLTVFDDSRSYLNKGAADAGRNVPNYGLKIRVIGESADRTAARVLIYR